MKVKSYSDSTKSRAGEKMGVPVLVGKKGERPLFQSSTVNYSVYLHHLCCDQLTKKHLDIIAEEISDSEELFIIIGL